VQSEVNTQAQASLRQQAIKHAVPPPGQVGLHQLQKACQSHRKQPRFRGHIPRKLLSEVKRCTAAVCQAEHRAARPLSLPQVRRGRQRGVRGQAVAQHEVLQLAEVGGDAVLGEQGVLALRGVVDQAVGGPPLRGTGYAYWVANV
jgi:hypothetical protein